MYVPSGCTMNFDWDEEKNQINIRNHGLDFEDAHEVFMGPHIIFDDSRFDYDEQRLIAFGFSNNRVVAVVFTELENSIRIISMRKANAKEKKRIQNRLG